MRWIRALEWELFVTKAASVPKHQKRHWNYFCEIVERYLKVQMCTLKSYIFWNYLTDNWQLYLNISTQLSRNSYAHTAVNITSLICQIDRKCQPLRASSCRSAQRRQIVQEDMSRSSFLISPCVSARNSTKLYS